jgi:hypothetical protein
MSDVEKTLLKDDDDIPDENDGETEFSKYSNPLILQNAEELDIINEDDNHSQKEDASQSSDVLPKDIIRDSMESEDDLEFIFPLPMHKFVDVHSQIPESKPFSGMTLDQLTVQLESSLFSAASIQRAIGWVPKPGDIIISAAPRCGQSLVAQMVRLICAGTEEVFNEIIEVPQRTPPWLECALVDQEPDVLYRKQPGTNRVFRTTMTHSMLSTKMASCPEAKFISVFRNPLDLRIAWFEDLRRFYAKHECQRKKGTSQENLERDFLRWHHPDQIANSAVTQVNNTSHSQRRPEAEYEYSLRDWVTIAHDKENCLLLFLEEVLASPETVLRKIAKFVGRDKVLDETVYERILKECTGLKMIEISRRHSGFLTPEQESLIKLKFAPEEESSKDVFGNGQNRQIELKRMESSNASISERGIFTELTRKNNDAGAPDGGRAVRKSDLVASLQLGEQVDFSPLGLNMIRNRWADVFTNRSPSYEDLYETLTGTKYPSVRMGNITGASGRRTFRLTRYSSSSTSDRSGGSRRFLRRFRSAEEESTTSIGKNAEQVEVGAVEFSPPSNRRTLVGRLSRSGSKQ